MNSWLCIPLQTMVDPSVSFEAVIVRVEVRLSAPNAVRFDSHNEFWSDSTEPTNVSGKLTVYASGRSKSPGIFHCSVVPDTEQV